MQNNTDKENWCQGKEDRAEGGDLVVLVGLGQLLYLTEEEDGGGQSGEGGEEENVGPGERCGYRQVWSRGKTFWAEGEVGEDGRD